MNLRVVNTICPKCDNKVKAVRVFKSGFNYDTGIQCNQCGFKEKIDISKELGFNNLKLNL